MVILKKKYMLSNQLALKKKGKKIMFCACIKLSMVLNRPLELGTAE